MKFTQDVVRQHADWATRVTGDQFRLQGIGGDLGYGVRYIDGVRQLVWLGKYGAREAAAYYLGAGAKWAELTGATVPPEQADALAILRRVDQPRSVREQVGRGADDAIARHEIMTRR